jgi:hypothetical protein
MTLVIQNTTHKVKAAELSPTEGRDAAPHS